MQELLEYLLTLRSRLKILYSVMEHTGDKKMQKIGSIWTIFKVILKVHYIFAGHLGAAEHIIIMFERPY